MSSSNVTRWGILSAGKISHDFVNSLTSLPEDKKGNHKVVAIAARNVQDAQKFADSFDIPKAYGDYQQLAQDKEIDVVYVGTLNPFHIENVKMLIRAGKNILCEKPMGMNVKETKEMIALAKEKKVFLMEAMWSWFQPAHQKLREEIKNGAIGEVMHVQVTFGFIIDMARQFQKKLGGGSTIDQGVYTTYFTMLCMGGDKPEKIMATGSLNEEGVDLNVSAALAFSKGRTATVSTHTRVNLPCEAEVFGRKGSMKLSWPFWSAHELTKVDGTKEQFPVRKGRCEFNFPNSAGLAHEAEHVRECLLKGLTESPVVSFRDSLTAAGIMETIRKQVGVVYDQDAE